MENWMNEAREAVKKAGEKMKPVAEEIREKAAPVAEKSDSGIVCVSSIAKLLRTFSLCDSLRHLTQANVVMKILSLVLGAGIVAFLFYISGLSRITGLFVLIYQLLWLIPVVIPSLTE